jgi:phosphonate transport system substrate-binding protein
MPTSPRDDAGGLIGGLDSNLDFPLDDPAWERFARSTNCSIRGYVDLDMLTSKVRQQKIDFSYLPSASCYFLRDTPYRGIVSAKTPLTHQPSQNSVFVVAKSNPVKRWTELRGKRLGYINNYCTTSYFAPSILVGREGFALKDFFNAFPVTAWQGQIDAVLGGEIDATMVYEDVWLAKSANADATKILARIDGLPTPPFIIRNNLRKETADALQSTLLSMPAASAPGALYAGFADFQEQSMQQLFAQIAALPRASHAA